MQLRCLAGAYAGQIRDYAFVAGMAALATGMAERIESTTATRPPVRSDAATSKRKTAAASTRAR